MEEILEEFVWVVPIDRSIDSHQFVKELIGSEEISPLISSSPSSDHGELKIEIQNEYDWKLNNKYYEADIKVIVSEDIKTTSDQLKNGIVCCLCDAVSSESWLRTTNLIEQLIGQLPEIDSWLIVCPTLKSCSDQDRQNKLGWCAKFKVELVSLNEELSTKDVANDEDEDDEFKEDPYERLREVVSTVSWRNASIHIHTPRMSFDASDELNVIKKCLNDRVVSDESPEAAPLASSVPGSAKTADNMEDDEDDDKNSFEKLFGKLHEMKEHADHLEGESKYQFAEKVARAFMQTLQLSGDEIGGEDSDIDEFGSFQKFE